MLVRIWRNWKICTLLGAMLNGASAMANSMVVPQNIKTELPYVQQSYF